MVPAIRLARRLKAIDVIDILSDLFLLAACWDTFVTTMGPGLVIKAVRTRIHAVVPQAAPGTIWITFNAD